MPVHWNKQLLWDISVHHWFSDNAIRRHQITNISSTRDTYTFDLKTGYRASKYVIPSDSAQISEYKCILIPLPPPPSILLILFFNFLLFLLSLHIWYCWVLLALNGNHHNLWLFNDVVVTRTYGSAYVKIAVRFVRPCSLLRVGDWPTTESPSSYLGLPQSANPNPSVKSLIWFIYVKFDFSKSLSAESEVFKNKKSSVQTQYYPSSD